MVGITSFGAYIPYLRLPLAAISGGKKAEGGPEKAVANYDEDALTLAVAAGIDCLRGIDRKTIDGVLFASTSYAFKEKQGAAIVAKALDLRRDVLTADVGDSLRAGTNALRAAIDSVKAGSAKRVLVVIGDTRMAAPARRSRATSATRVWRSSSATATSRPASPARTASRTRSSTCGAPRAIRSCTRGRTASSSTTATAPT